MKKKTKQPNKQEVALRYIRENYLDFGRLRRDLISDQVQIQNPDGTWRDFNTVDINDIVCNCSLETGIQITPKEVQQVTISSHVPSVHPLRDYVYACENPKYYSPGGPDWIDWLAQQVSVEGDEQEQLFWRMCFKKWFVAMVASWLYDDVVNHQVLILIGPQGIFKTTWLEFLIVIVVLEPHVARYHELDFLTLVEPMSASGLHTDTTKRNVSASPPSVPPATNPSSSPISPATDDGCLSW